MILVKLKAKGKVEGGIVVPDLPDFRYKWRICKYDRNKNEFEVICELDDEKELEKIKNYIVSVGRL